MLNLNLIQKEKKLRNKLAKINYLMRSDTKTSRKISPFYQKAYLKWVKLRNKGVKKGLFKFFVPGVENKGYPIRKANNDY